MSSPDDPPADHSSLLIEIGRAVIAWNDLDQLVRNMIFQITMNDALSVLVLTADMNTSALLTALRALTVEHDASASNSYKGILENVEGGGHLIKPHHMSPHVHHFADYVDRLREYRNFYLHGIKSSSPPGGFLAHSMTARGRLSVFSKPITAADLVLLTDGIRRCVAYGTAVSVILSGIGPYALPSSKAAPPTWPEKPPLPDKLVKPRRVLLGEKDPPPSSRE